MDRNSFWQELIDVIKLHRKSSHPVEQLSEEQMDQLESNVYAHIDQLFPNSKVMPATADTGVTVTADSEQKSSHKQSHSLWAGLFQHRHVPVYAMAMFALLSVGVLALLFSDNRTSEPLFEIPESVVAADVDRYIQIPQQNMRAITGTNISERRRAFLAGITQADLDLIGDTDTPTAHQMALWYHHITTNTPAADAFDALKTVQSSVNRFSTNEQTSLWLKHGYAVEVVHLAAKRSMTDLNTSALADALQFYSIQELMSEHDNTEPNNPELKSSLADIPRQYMLNHEQLIVANPAQLITPEQVQAIIDMTNNMKVLIQ